MEADLVAHFDDVLGRTVTLDSDFFEAGGDSLGALRSPPFDVDLHLYEAFCHM